MRCNTAEKANLPAIQAEERSKHKLKFLEKSYYELETEKLSDEGIEAPDKAVLVKLELKHDEDITSSLCPLFFIKFSFFHQMRARQKL